MGRVMGLEPMIFWATTRRVNPYTTPAMSAHQAAQVDITTIALGGQGSWDKGVGQSHEGIARLEGIG